MNRDPLSMDQLIAQAKAHPDIHRAGMILCHNGFVRESDRSGKRRVKALHVSVDQASIEDIRSWAESQPGIVTVIIRALEGEFRVGEDLLYIVVAGDIRENVFRVMRETVERAKAAAVHKQEQYED